jgi:mono/diheme cytochrome c family protein
VDLCLAAVTFKPGAIHFTTALALCAGAVLSPAHAQPTSAEWVETGRKAYTSYCTRCHGINLVVTGAAFYDLRTFPRDDKERFLTSVNKGKRAMPAWEGVVKPEDVEAIWAYIGNVNGWVTK